MIIFIQQICLQIVTNRFFATEKQSTRDNRVN
jgi:hypothetical protein